MATGPEEVQPVRQTLTALGIQCDDENPRHPLVDHGSDRVDAFLSNGNGSAFIVRDTGDLLAAWGILHLRSPGATPQYNGSCEAANGSHTKTTNDQAALAGHPDHWTSKDLQQARMIRNRPGRWIPKIILMRAQADITAAIMTVMALLAGAVPTWGGERDGGGPAAQETVVRAANGEDSSPRQLERLVFLSHPYAWELQFARHPESAETYRWANFSAANLVAMERRVSSRWPQEIRKLGSKDALILNYFGGRPPDAELEKGPIAPLLRAAREHLGDRYLLLFGTQPRNEWGREIQRQLRERGYTYDPAMVLTESWGQSSEGCVVNFAAHFAEGMGLAKGFPMRYGLTFPDAPFAMTGNFLERVALGDSDVSLYLSESKEGRSFAIFFPGVLRDGESNRYVELVVDPASVEFTNKKGEPVTVPREEGRFRIPLYVDGYGLPVYIWEKDIKAPALKAALAAARVSPRAPE